MKRTIVFQLAILLILASAASAEVKLHPLFTDHMVLQRDAKIAVWGTADAGEAVTVKLADAQANATADADGHWRVQLGPMKATGPQQLSVAGKANTITLKDILIGEVWLCSGQSNMAFSVGGSTNAAEEIKAADHPDIRLFTVPRRPSETPQDNVAGAWQVCSPKTVGRFSAVGYFFGRELHKALKVPVGLIHSSWGGTAAELWTSEQGLAGVESLKDQLARRDAGLKRLQADKAGYDQKVADWQKAVEKAKAEGAKPPARPRQPRLGLLPTFLYNGMIHPLIRFRIAGAIWYQGEANASRAQQYETLFPTMITDWRKKWGYDFPFVFVQLANYMPRSPEPRDSQWAHLRDAQTKTLNLDKTGMAVIIDIGQARNIHPKNKQDVGRRLALAARAVAYGDKEVEFSGPMLEAMTVEGDKVRLTFRHAGGGLVIGPPPGAITAGPDEAPRPGADKLVGFAVAGADKVFHWAEATVEGQDVVVRSEKVAKPVAVRYAWGNNPACNLYNREGLPACPFRTDQW